MFFFLLYQPHTCTTCSNRNSCKTWSETLAEIMPGRYNLRARQLRIVGETAFQRQRRLAVSTHPKLVLAVAKVRLGCAHPKNVDRTPGRWPASWAFYDSRATSWYKLLLSQCIPSDALPRSRICAMVTILSQYRIWRMQHSQLHYLCTFKLAHSLLEHSCSISGSCSFYNASGCFSCSHNERCVTLLIMQYERDLTGLRRMACSHNTRRLRRSSYANSDVHR